MTAENGMQILINAGLSEDQGEALLNVADAFIRSDFADDIGNAADVLHAASFINQVEHEALRELDKRIKLEREIAAACGDNTNA
jgi:hypothetical protein